MAGIGFGAAAVLGVGAFLGVNVANANNSGSASAAGTGSSQQQPGAGFPGYSGSSGSSGSGSSGSTGGGSSTSNGTTAVTGTAATTAQSQGIVFIDTTVDYGEAEAAGTGMVLTSDGEILTNNHVVEGATKITVEIATTGKKYTATVVGTDATDDVAVLKLQNASGLTTAKFDTAGDLAAGDSVTGVGNAQGGGKLIAASGTVTALNQSLTTQAEAGAASESLSGMIETNAAIQSGDSGGPLYASDGEIVGMDTAASASGEADSYAIPISTAMSIAQSIASGTGGANIQLGYPAFLGVEVAPSTADNGYGYGYGYGDSQQQQQQTQTSGATISGVIDGTPAATAGLEAGDVITAVNGTSIAASSELSTTLGKYSPGDKVTITYTDGSGQTQQAQVTLAEGPAA
jgi:S1-C subfamily serine protease